MSLQTFVTTKFVSLQNVCCYKGCVALKFASPQMACRYNVCVLLKVVLVVLQCLWTRSFESEEIVQYHFSDINWAQGQNMSHLINCQCINGYLKTLVRKLKLVSCF